MESLKVYGPTGRLGTEVSRAEDVEYMIRSLIHGISANNEPNKIPVVDDEVLLPAGVCRECD